jgi:hypothetical protein
LTYALSITLLTYVLQLSKEAQDWAEYLLHENKWEFSHGKDYSENIFQFFGEISQRDVMRKAVDNWYSALNKYNWNFPEANTFSQVTNLPANAIIWTNYKLTINYAGCMEKYK